MTYLITGEISQSMGLEEALEFARELKDVEHGVLRIESDTVSGDIGISSGEHITGAKVDGGTETGLTALKKLLSLKEGKFSYVRAKDEEIMELDQDMKVPLDSFLRTSDDGAPDSDQEVDGEEGTVHGTADEVPEERSAVEALADSEESFEPATSELEEHGEQTSDSNVVAEAGSDEPEATEAAETAETVTDSTKQAGLTPPAPSGGGGGSTLSKKWLAEKWLAENRTEAPVEAQDKSSRPDKAVGDKSSATARDSQSKLSAADKSKKPDSDSLTKIAAVGAAGRQDQSSGSSPKAEPPKAELTQAEIEAREQMSQDLKKLKTTSLKMTAMSAGNPAVSVGPSPVSKEVAVQRALHATITWTSVAFVVLVGVFAWQKFQTSSSEKHLNTGTMYINSGMQEQALRELSDAINANPEHNPSAYVDRGNIYLTMNKPQDALSDFRKAAELDKTSAKAVCGRGSAYFALGKFEQAAIDYNKAMKMDPANAEPYRLRGKLYFSNHFYQRAIADFKKVLTMAGSSATVGDYEAVAQVQFDSGNYADAAASYAAASRKDPNRQLDMLRKAECLKQVGDLKGALSAYQAAIRIDPTEPSAYFESGKCYMGLKKYELAVTAFGDALSRKSVNKEALLNRASCFVLLKQYGHAVDDFDALLKLDPNAKGVKEQRAQAYTRLLAVKKNAGDKAVAPQEPAVDLKKIAERAKTDEPGVVQIGISFINNGDAETGVQVLAIAIKANPSDALARRTIAYALVGLGQEAQAASQFSALSRLTQLAEPDQIAYAKALSGGGHPNEAIHVLMAVMRTNPESDDAQIALIQTYSNNGMADQAKQVAQGAMAKAKSQVMREKYNELLNSVNGGSSSGSSGQSQPTQPARPAHDYRRES